MYSLLKSVDSIISASPNYLRTNKVLQCYKDKTEVIPIGLGESSYPELTNDSLADIRARVGEWYFLFVGVFRYYKGLSILLEACVNQDYRAVIVGAGSIEAELKKKQISLA
jgi:glycosyltransferase involved in cell wall biosynthesis